MSSSCVEFCCSLTYQAFLFSIFLPCLSDCLIDVCFVYMFVCMSLSLTSSLWAVLDHACVSRSVVLLLFISEQHAFLIYLKYLMFLFGPTYLNFLNLFSCKKRQDNIGNLPYYEMSFVVAIVHKTTRELVGYDEVSLGKKTYVYISFDPFVILI